MMVVWVSEHKAVTEYINVSLVIEPLCRLLRKPRCRRHSLRYCPLLLPPSLHHLPPRLLHLPPPLLLRHPPPLPPPHRSPTLSSDQIS